MSRPGRYPKGLERRREILETAYRVLSQDGYKRTSLREIGRAIGVDAAHIVYYFGSREELLQEVLQRWDALNHVEWEPGADAFQLWLAAVQQNTRNPGIMQLYTAFAAEAADESHPAHDFFRARFDQVQASLASDIERRQREGTVSPHVDAQGVAAILISLSDGLQIRWLIDRSLDMAAIVSLALDTALGGSTTSPAVPVGVESSR